MLPTRVLIRFGDIWGKQSTSTISNVLSQGLQRDHSWRWSLLKVRGLCPSIVPMRGGIPGLNEFAVAQIELPGRQDLDVREHSERGRLGTATALTRCWPTIPSVQAEL